MIMSSTRVDLFLRGDGDGMLVGSLDCSLIHVKCQSASKSPKSCLFEH